MKRHYLMIKSEIAEARQQCSAAQRKLHIASSNVAAGDRAARIEECAAEVGVAFGRLEGLYRELAHNSSVEAVVPLNTGVDALFDAPEAVLLQNEGRAILTFNATRLTPEGREEPCGIAVARFETVVASRFGLPNDEALAGHPLYDQGLSDFPIGEVLNSRWICEAERQNRVVFPNAAPWKDRVHHYVVSFHYALFECIADGVSWTTSQKEWGNLHRALLDEVYGFGA